MLLTKPRLLVWDGLTWGMLALGDGGHVLSLLMGAGHVPRCDAAPSPFMAPLGLCLSQVRRMHFQKCQHLHRMCLEKRHC